MTDNTKQRFLFKVFFLFLLITGISYTANATQSDENITELLNQLEVSKSDTASLSLLYQVAYQLHKSEPQRTLTYVEEGIRLAKKNNKELDLGRFLYIQARVFRQIGKGQNALENLDDAIRILKRKVPMKNLPMPSMSMDGCFLIKANLIWRAINFSREKF